MLTKEHAIAQYDFQRQRILPDRLTSVQHAHYLSFAEQMLNVYRTGTGRRRGDLHRDIHRIFADEVECPLRRIEAFCKLLDDQSHYADAGRREAPKLRQQVFRIAARHHPLVSQADRLFDNAVEDVRELIARELQREWFDIRSELFADIIENHEIESFEGYPDPRALLSRYNVAQVQATLFRAVSMVIDASTDFKRILRAARLAKLMHTISRTGEGAYRIRLDGPASVLRQTRRYGVWMARFLPALICCQGWKMHAVVETRNRWKLSLDLSDRDGLHSHLPSESEFDSSVEADFAKKWGDEVREGWSLEREAEVLYSGQKTFIPDFVFRHNDGRVVLMEIIGFWTPEYIAARLETLAVFREAPILLAIHESTSHHFESSPGTAIVVTYKSALLVKPVLQALATLFSGGAK
ncbi:MAG TPA: DUF790 family protein [Planctomycetaceae bacterium]|nr:DUF790 family protein [Planctomycetaceae bacterium]